MAHFRKLGSPGNIGQKAQEDKFIEMLNELDQWADSLGFGSWKRAAINGSIEGSLRKTYGNCGVDDLVSAYVKLSYNIIMKMNPPSSSPPSSPLAGINTFLTFVAVVVSIVAGLINVPAIIGILSGTLLFEIAYVRLRVPQMARVWARDGIKIVKLVIYQLGLYAMVAGVFYWFGRGVTWLFS
jgi:hypothetical protein